MKKKDILKELLVPNSFEWEEMMKLAVFSEWYEKYFKSDHKRFESCYKAYRLFESRLSLKLLIKIIATSKCGTKKEIKELKKLL